MNGPDDSSRVYYLAPLAGYTDLPFRRTCRRHGCRYAFTPLVDAGALVHENPRNRTLLLRGKDEEWLGTQVLGGNPEFLKQAGRILRPFNFDVVDFNLGCPVPKVMQRGAGAALARNAEHAALCAAALMEGYGSAVTAKIRILSTEDPGPTLELVRRLERAGVAGITVHGRIWERRYSGPVSGDIIGAVARAATVPVIANGGVFSRESADALAESSGCRCLMVARGAIGNPWIFRRLMDPAARLPTHEEICEELCRHVGGMVELYGESVAMRNGRKIILAYLVGRGYLRMLRARVTSIATWDEFRHFLAVIRREGPQPGH